MTWTAMIRITAVSALVMAFATSVTLAQPRQGMGMGMGMGMPQYDKATEETLTGTVQEVQSHQGHMGMTGTHLMFEANSGAVEVHVGPSNWLADKKYEFAKGDQVQIIGSKIKIDGKDAFLAREIRKGGVTMTLRDENGIPAWSGQGPGQGPRRMMK